jgi:hypothetical protein
MKIAARQKPLEGLAGYIFREISQFPDASETFLSGTVREEVAEISQGFIFARSNSKVEGDHEVIRIRKASFFSVSTPGVGIRTVL